MEKQQTGKNKRLARSILDWVLTIAVALAIALPLRAFGFELVRVEGGSMNNTLANGEIMFVTKYDYATAWLSLPWQDAAAQESALRITAGGNPQRFDVVICRYPGRGSTNFVKRVVGLPGDTVEIRSGYLYVNGEKCEEPYIDDAYRSGRQQNFGPFTVPEGEYFVLGDHRNNSNDSRAQGTISRDRIIGHVRTVLLPLSELRSIE